MEAFAAETLLILEINTYMYISAESRSSLIFELSLSIFLYKKHLKHFWKLVGEIASQICLYTQ